MEAIELGCKKCGSEDFELLDAKTGEVRCRYCRNRWVEPSLIQRTETEKFLAEQAKRPQVIIDNTTETDKQIMDIISKVAGVATGGCARRALRYLVLALVILAVIAIMFFLGATQLFR